MRRLRSRPLLLELGMDPDLVDDWLRDPTDGALLDEVRARVEGVPATYGHVIVDEAQDLSLLQLRAMQRRSAGLTLVGDDAQRSAPHGLGLRGAAVRLDVEPAEMATAYRMSAEIAGWLNEHAAAHGIDAVELLGIRPTGVEVDEVPGDRSTAEAHHRDLAEAWPNTALITAEDTWGHKGVEYDAVVVDTAGMDAPQIYLAASRAAHQLTIIHP
jgi:DNA helicase IV